MAGRSQEAASGAHRILVVDDEDTIREALVDILRETGYVAVGATNGRDGLRKLREARVPFSLILLDLTMPVLDGRGFRQEQRRDPALASIPVVIVSAYRDAAVKAADLEAAAYLPKPPNLPVLLDVVQAHLPRR
jgi:CheY-like chemotaxis protein